MTEENLKRGIQLLELIKEKKKQIESFDEGTKSRTERLEIGYIGKGNYFRRVRESTVQETVEEGARLDDELYELQKEFDDL
jgi:ABC-type Mn2+/Zn2+ transport system ATPase subunit